jgi:cytochrome c biogenesis protein CcdA/thiol-disulfide isomerase/thioredoxin
MILFALSYLAGVLTILAPCILPVVPFVFARVGDPFIRRGLPLLVGMALSFAGVATVATLGGAWAADASEIGRGVAMVVLALLGLSLLLPRLADRWTRPLVALGVGLADNAERAAPGSVWPSFALGAATGLLWAPCAGPVLGVVLTTAALQGASARTSLLLLSYAGGAATSLAAALWVGGRVYAAMKRLLGVGEWLRRGLGATVIASVALVALGLDTDLLARLTPAGGFALEQKLIERLHVEPEPRVERGDLSQRAAHGLEGVSFAAVAPAVTASAPLDLPVEGVLPDLAGATTWLNSPPLSAEALRGKVVLVDFWTYACINCRRALPYVRAWAEKYEDQGLIVIGVHAPEFAFERDVENVKRAAADLGLHFPIAIDNSFSIWRSFSNRYWPANYFVDARGRIRFHHFGEGEYERSEQVIRQLLDEAHRDAVAATSMGASDAGGSAIDAYRYGTPAPI